MIDQELIYNNFSIKFINHYNLYLNNYYISNSFHLSIFK